VGVLGFTGSTEIRARSFLEIEGSMILIIEEEEEVLIDTMNVSHLLLGILMMILISLAQQKHIGAKVSVLGLAWSPLLGVRMKMRAIALAPHHSIPAHKTSLALQVPILLLRVCRCSLHGDVELV